MIRGDRDVRGCILDKVSKCFLLKSPRDQLRQHLRPRTNGRVLVLSLIARSFAVKCLEVIRSGNLQGRRIDSKEFCGYDTHLVNVPMR